jgi:cysteinyl-tRNA synthetase
VRYLRFSGYRVRYIQNITDVGHLLDSGEDRILKGSGRERIEPMELVEKYTRSYFDDMDALNVLRPDISPRASAHIPEQIELVKSLIEKGFGYEVNGSVYYDITKFKDYGILSHRSIEDQEAGTRVEVSEDKRHPADFALWKKAEPEHIMRWLSPWGWGFPGWHLECSSMAMKYLGETIDIHGGGMENMFPHHECEIAQSTCATGKPFVKYWLHNNMVMVDGTKMSKSLGNFTTLKDALKKYKAEQIRFFILTSHYRSPIDFSDKALNAAGQGLSRLFGLLKTLEIKLKNANSGQADKKISEVMDARKKEFIGAMDDDFNTAAAIGVMFETVKDVNTWLDSKNTASRESLELVQKFFTELAGNVLGITPFSAQESGTLDEELMDILIDLRKEFRSKKEWERADVIRDRLSKIGIVLEDGKEGTLWHLQ